LVVARKGWGFGGRKNYASKKLVFLPPNSLPAFSKLTPPPKSWENLLLLIFNIFKNISHSSFSISPKVNKNDIIKI